jgi:serine/threonine-protein kinase
MNGSTVFIVAFFTSVVTSIGTVYLVERLDVFDGVGNAQGEITVPNFQGLEEEEAVAHAKSLGLVVMIQGREFSATSVDGVVLRQTVVAGQTVSRGQSVGVTLAKAMPRVPAVVGQSLEQATETLKQAGYQVQHEVVDDEKVPEGQIASQSPERGTALEKEKVVTVRLSTGGVVEVPRLIGSTYTGATKALEDIGLKGKVRWVDLAETSSGIVLSQTPEPGDKVKKGRDVEIVINRE